MKIKIIHIAKTIGGVGVYTSLLSMYIDADQFENIIIHNNLDNNIPHINSKQKNITTYHVPIEREISMMADIKVLNQISKIIASEKPNLIHCHSAKAGVLGRIIGNRLKIPVLYTPHAYSFLSTDSRFKKKIYKYIENKLGNLKYSTLLACSESEKKQAIAINIKPNKILVWNNSIPKITIDKQQVSNKKIIIIARTTYQKNLKMLIEVAEILEKKYKKTIPFSIIGADKNCKEYNLLNELIKAKKISNIQFLDWTTRELTLKLLANAKMVLSTSRYEGLPYGLIESLALGKVIIATNVDGNKDLIEDNYNGYLIDNFSSAEMAKKTNYLLENKVLLSQFENNAKELYLDKFNILKNISILEKIYTNAVSSK